MWLKKSLSAPCWPAPCSWRQSSFCRRKYRNFYKNRENLKFASWNVRTLLDLPNSSRPERRTALLAKELSNYGVDIAALSETRLSGENQRVEVGAGYTFFWKGKDEGIRRTGGVGFAIKSHLLDKIDHPIPITDRIMTL